MRHEFADGETETVGVTAAGTFSSLVEGKEGRPGEYSTPGDQILIDRVLAICPESREWAKNAKAALFRSVRSALSALEPDRIEQLVDLGCGPPSEELGPLHELALSTNPAARIAYVDVNRLGALNFQFEKIDPAHLDRVALVEADIMKVKATVRAIKETGLIDFDRPMVLAMGLVSHRILDDDVLTALLKNYYDAIPPHSRMVITAPCSDIPDGELRSRCLQVTDIYRTANQHWKLRNRANLEQRVAWAPQSPPPQFMPAWDLCRGIEPEYAHTDEEKRRWGYAMVAAELVRLCEFACETCSRI